MAQSNDAQKRKDAFIEAYLVSKNGTDAAKRAGYSVSRAAITGSELLRDTYVKEQLRKHQELAFEAKTDASRSIEDIFDHDTVVALEKMATAAKNDPDAAKQFLEMKLKFDKQREDVLGEYENLSTEEIIDEFNRLAEEAKELISRIVEEKRTETLQEQSDVLSQSSIESPRSSEKCVGEDTPQDSKPISNS